MPNTKISALTALTALAIDDVVGVVDISDTSMAASGTTKLITVANLFGSLTTMGLGTGSAAVVTIGGGATASELRFLEPSGSGTNYSAFKAIAQSANITYSLPPTVGAAGTVLTDVAGNGVLTWATGGGGGATTALDNLAAVNINTDLLFNGVSSGSATKPALTSFVGNTTQYDKISQAAGLIKHDALGSATNIGYQFMPKGTGGTAFGVANPGYPMMFHIGTNHNIAFFDSGITYSNAPGISTPDDAGSAVVGDLVIATSNTYFRVAGGSANAMVRLDHGTGNISSVSGGLIGFVNTTSANGVSPDAAINRFAPKVVAAGSTTATADNWFVDAGTKRVSTQFDATSNTTLANVTGLSAVVQAGRTYTFEAVLYTTSNVGAGVKAAIAGTATATAIIYEAETSSASVPVAVGTARGTSLATAVGDVTAVTVARIVIKGTITVNAAGTLTVQFAQNVSNAAASSVLVGSSFVVKDNP